MSVESPIFIFPRFAKGEPEPSMLLERLNEYGRVFFDTNRPNTPIVLMGISIDNWEAIDISQFDFLRIYRISKPTNNFFYFSLKSFLLMRNLGYKPRILISGDIFFGFLSAFLIKKIWLRLSTPIQISIHGYYLETLVFKRFIPPFLLKHYILVVYHLADSIRVVSDQLRLNLINKYGISSSKIFVAPIPVRLQKFSQSTLRRIEVLFVGRFHIERGIDTLTNICRELSSFNTSEKIVLVGDGPLRFATEQNLKSYKNIIFKGFVSPSVLAGLMQDSKILLSTAPLEGYGLAVREALASGCIVVARRNEVTKDLNTDFPNSIFLFETESEALEIIAHHLSKRINYSETRRFRAKLEMSNAQALQSLIASW